MKHFLIFLIFCFAEIHRIYCDALDIQDKQLEKICAKELNIDINNYYYYTKDSGEYESIPKQYKCLTACFIRRRMPEELIGFNNKETLYNAILLLIDDGFYRGFANNDTGISREHLFDRVEQCYVRERSECGFFQCAESHMAFSNAVCYNTKSDTNSLY